MRNCAMRWPRRNASAIFPVAYSELRSEHFLLRYDGQQNEKLSGEILNSLDGSFQDLVLDLDYSPTEAIVVILYPNQAFRDITRTPAWVGALNDGKIRVPVSGLTQMTPDLARVLKHELTHSFVRLITLGHCPTWFNEGLAQLEEGSTHRRAGKPVGAGPGRREDPSLCFARRIFCKFALRSGGPGLRQVFGRARIPSRHFRHGGSPANAAANVFLGFQHRAAR